MKNTEQFELPEFELPEMEKIGIPSDIVSQEVGRELDGYRNLLINTLNLNNEAEIVGFEEELAKKLGVLAKLKEFIERFGKPINDENYLKQKFAI